MISSTATSSSLSMPSTGSHLDSSSSCTDEVSPVPMDQDVLTCSRDLEQETDIICLSSDEVQVDHPPQGAIPVVSQPSTADNVSSEISSDIGSIITPSKPIDDIYQSMKTLDNAEKYFSLFGNVRPPDKNSNHTFSWM